MKKIIIVLAFFLVLSTLGCTSANSTAILASGQIEAKQIAIAPEVSGRVGEVSSKKGMLSKLATHCSSWMTACSCPKRGQPRLPWMLPKPASGRPGSSGFSAGPIRYDPLRSPCRRPVPSPGRPGSRLCRASSTNRSGYFPKDEEIRSRAAEIDAAKAALERNPIPADPNRTERTSTPGFSS